MHRQHETKVCFLQSACVARCIAGGIPPTADHIPNIDSRTVRTACVCQIHSTMLPKILSPCTSITEYKRLHSRLAQSYKERKSNKAHQGVQFVLKADI